jgi:hypothetical protein
MFRKNKNQLPKDTPKNVVTGGNVWDPYNGSSKAKNSHQLAHFLRNHSTIIAILSGIIGVAIMAFYITYTINTMSIAENMKTVGNTMTYKPTPLSYFGLKYLGGMFLAITVVSLLSRRWRYPTVNILLNLVLATNLFASVINLIDAYVRIDQKEEVEQILADWISDTVKTNVIFSDDFSISIPAQYTVYSDGNSEKMKIAVERSGDGDFMYSLIK